MNTLNHIARQCRLVADAIDALLADKERENPAVAHVIRMDLRKGKETRHKGPGRPKLAVAHDTTTGHKMSPKARANMRRAQQKRWKAIRAAKAAGQQP